MLYFSACVFCVSACVYPHVHVLRSHRTPSSQTGLTADRLLSLLSVPFPFTIFFPLKRLKLEPMYQRILYNFYITHHSLYCSFSIYYPNNYKEEFAFFASLRFLSINSANLFSNRSLRTLLIAYTSARCRFFAACLACMIFCFSCFVIEVVEQFNL